MKNRPPTEDRSNIEDLFLTGINAVDAYEITKRSMSIQGSMLRIADHQGHQECYDLSRIKRILIAGFGKAAYPMAQAVEQTMPHRITKGFIITPHGTGTGLNRIDVIEAGHPIPDNDGIYGAQRIADMLQHAAEDDLVVLLVSGGGSALCTSPAQGLTFGDLRKMNEVLLRSGANIEEINTIRKHMSSVKGGQLARLAHPAKMAVMIISDVIGDPPHTIASGPAAPDPSTFCEARDILQKYGLSEHTPPRIRARLEAGCRGDIPETPKPGDPLFRHTRNIIIANNLTALRSIAKHAKQKGYESFILTSRLSGDTRRVARVFASMIIEFTRITRTTSMPVCIISGGEMTTRVEGEGLGGRNGDFCLSLVPIIKGLKRVQILAAGTDGIDGNTDAAGAIVNGDTYEHARALGLDVEQALANYDAYTFFKATGSLVITGPTRTNVMDIQIALID
jgi:glycerate 2-kinase